MSTGQGLLSNNMFTYCGNNPVIHSDPSGYRFGPTSSQIKATYFLSPGQRGTARQQLQREAGLTSGDSFVNTAVAYIMNDDESTVLRAEYFSFYKGVPVFKVDLPEGVGFSCVAIFLDVDNVVNNDFGVQTLRHEYGHVRHLAQIGLPTYVSNVVAPSMLGAYLWNRGDISVDYYSLPWERIADYLGRVEGRTYESWSGYTAGIYWMYTYVAGLLS